jgi:hypothetical protein
VRAWSRRHAGRRAIEERLLDLQFDEEKRQLQAQIEEAARLRALADRTKSAQDLANGRTGGGRRQGSRKVGWHASRAPVSLPSSRTPSQRRARLSSGREAFRIRPTEINEALQSIEVKGLDGLTDAITGVITGTESLKSAFHNLAASILADLVQMTIKMLIFKMQAELPGPGSRNDERCP